MKKVAYLCIVALVLVSCNKYSSGTIRALDEAGENKQELEKVLNFYKTNPADSLKYKAAVFLIENMSNHYSYKSVAGFEGAFDSISNYPMDGLRRGIFEKILDSVSQKISFKKPELIPDAKCITSKYLIDNIELSFKAWNKIRKNKRASFDDFCNYILPYKNSDEPIEENSREKLVKKYSWVYNELNKGTSIHTIVDSIASEFGHVNMVQIRKYYPIPLSISHIERSRLGLCDDGVNYLVNVFRALGIISTKDMISHWGNHPSSGHSWVYVKYGSEEYATDVAGKVDLKVGLRGESIPKVNRATYKNQEEYTFSPFAKDVTAEYVPTVNITISNILNAPHSQPVLYVFDRNSEWSPIAFGKYKDENNIFNNVGVNVLYLAGIQEENTFIPINYPFFIDNTKKIHFFKPSKSILDSVSLVRKCGLSSARNKTKMDWIKNLNDGFFQGANNRDFMNAEPLYQVNRFNSLNSKKIKISTSRKYRYVRFCANGKESFLDKLSFYDEKGKPLKGEIFKKVRVTWRNSTFDSDLFSFSGGGENFILEIAFEKPENLGFIEFRARNDGNQILVGDEYELLYWEKEWKTLGKQVAKDTVLYYSVPANSLLWLKDNTNGKEEHVFTIDKNKKQRWLGFDNY